MTWSVRDGSLSGSGDTVAFIPYGPGSAIVTATSAADGTESGSATVAVSGPFLTTANLQSIVWIGDSYAEQGLITNPLTAALQQQYGDGGDGWINLYYLTRVLYLKDVALTTNGTWIAENNTLTAKGVGLSDVSTLDVATPASLFVTVAAESASLDYFMQPGGGSFHWSVDGGTPLSIDTNSSAPSSETSTFSGLSPGAHTFQIEADAAGTSGITLDGMDVRTNATGTVVHNLGSAGATSAGWIAIDPSIWEPQFAALQPTLVVIMLSPNDQAANFTTTEQAANLTELIGRIRAVTPTVPIILAPPPENGVLQTPSMAAYNASQATLAQTLGVGYIDVFDQMGPFDPAYFDADKMHPNAKGGNLIAGIVLDGIESYLSQGSGSSASKAR